LYQSTIRVTSLRNAARIMERIGNACRSSFNVRMARSMTAMLPCWPTAPKRWRMSRRRH